MALFARGKLLELGGSVDGRFPDPLVPVAIGRQVALDGKLGVAMNNEQIDAELQKSPRETLGL